MGMPGKPAPEPKSRRVETPAGRARAQAMDSTKWRERMPSSSRMEVRLMRAFQRRKSESRVSKRWDWMGSSGDWAEAARRALRRAVAGFGASVMDAGLINGMVNL